MAKTDSKSPPPDTDNDSKLRELIDSAIELQKNGANQLLDHLEELKNDDNKRLNASSFTVKLHRSYTAIPSEYMLTVASCTREDFAMWKLCLETTLLNINAARYSPLEIRSKNVSVILDSTIVKEILEFIDPLVKRTNFRAIEIDSEFDVSQDEENIDELHKLIDLMMEHIQNETKKLTKFGKTIKNKRRRLEQMYFCFSQSDIKGRICIKVVTRRYDDVLMWKACVNNALVILEIDTQTQQNVCFFDISASSENMKRILDYMKPIAKRMHIHNLDLGEGNATSISKNSEFFKNLTGSVEDISLGPQKHDRKDFKFWIEFIRQIRPPCVHVYRQGLPNEIQEFLIPLGNMVGNISICERQTDIPLQPFPVSAIRDILSRKCKYLQIFGGITDLSFEASEELVNLFHHLEKPVKFIVPTTKIEPMNVTIGEYTVKVVVSEITPTSHIFIEHLGAPRPPV